MKTSGKVMASCSFADEEIYFLAYHVFMRNILKQARNFLLELLFPRSCFGCGSEGTICCKKCFGTIVCEPIQRCPGCQKPSPHGKTHESCRNSTSLDFLLVSSSYNRNKVLKKLISHLKYRGDQEDSAAILAILLKTTLLSHMASNGFVLIPIPLHRRRLAWRGFNQAEVLCKELCAIFPEITYQTDIAQRIRYTTPQVRVHSRAMRLKNLSGCFTVTQNSPGKFLLIDDVCTTGTTLDECAKALKAREASAVGALVIASNR